MNYYSEEDCIEMIKSVPIEKLIDTYGNSLYIYSEKIIKRQLKILKDNFKGFDIFYSFKSNPNPYICKYIKKQGHFADTASVGEVKLAVKCGFDKEEIIYSSPGKTKGEISGALGNVIIIADSINELELIDKICKRKGTVENVGIRINPLYSMNEASAQEVMSGVPSKFGIDEEFIDKNIDYIKSFENIKVTGIQIYMGSQITDYNILYNNFKNIYDIALKCMKQYGLELEFIDFGGGFGIQHSENEERLDIEKAGQMISEIINLAEYKCLYNVRRIIESGRFISANCGMYAAKVLDTKVSRGKSYAIIEGGMNTFFRPVFVKENRYPAYVVNKLEEKRTEKITLAGVMCTPIDIFEEEALLPKVEKGEIVVFLNTGAYGYTMSLTKFISHEEAKEIYITVEGDIKVV